MIRLSILSVLLVLSPLQARAGLYVTIIQGLDGNPQYGERFSEQTGLIKAAATSITEADAVMTIVGEQASRENILAYFSEMAAKTDGDDRIAVYLIGHGSFDGVEYKFNIPGPDLDGDDIISLLNDQPAGIQLLVNTSAASGAIAGELEADNRVVITATRNGNERLATRFGEYFFAALDDPAADTNKNDAITAREAFDYAERQVTDYYEREGVLATEHPLVSGEQAAALVLARTGLDRPPPDDAELAALIRQRDALDRSIEELQLQKGEMAADEFLTQLQQLMIDLSLVQEDIDARNGGETP